jgi:hypothetical protein
LLQEHGVNDPMVVKTRSGFHFHVRLAAGTFARNDSHESTQHPERIDVRTKGGLILLPPSTNKTLLTPEIKRVSQLPEVGQPFVDALFAHNGRTAPRPQEQRATPPSTEPATPQKLTDIKHVLATIDPDSGYDDWVRCLMAVFHETQGSDEGLAIADEWSSQGDKYCGFPEMQAKWKSFDLNATPVTMGSLVYIAREQNGQTVANNSRLGTALTAPSEVLSALDDDDPDASHPLAKFSVRPLLDALKRRAVDQVSILGNIGLQGQCTVIYAAPNTGKTLIMLHLIKEAILEKRIKGKDMFYLNMDDNGAGALEKGALSQDYGFEMLLPGENNFSVAEFFNAIKEMIAGDTARGSIIVLDTITKFVDTMNKSFTREFTTCMRHFALKGGTVVALGHVNKTAQQGKEVMYAGTSDVLNDFDAAYMLKESKSTAPSVKVVEFNRLKGRGFNDSKATYCYSTTAKSYSEILTSVQQCSDEDLRTLGAQEAIALDEALIAQITQAIRDGIKGKKDLLRRVMDESASSRRKVETVLDSYTGADAAKHRWKYDVKGRGRMEYSLLATDMALAPAVVSATPSSTPTSGSRKSLDELAADF